ncbi:diaminobutyrate acetyltransferase [Brachybacterium sp. DNPG3]
MGHSPRTLDDRLSIQENSSTPDDLVVTSPVPSDGAAMWRIARDSGTLDLNSSYAYLLLARDFASTSRVAISDGEVVGFVTGYRRPEAPERLFIWQVAVDSAQRGRRIAARMLDSLLADLADAPADDQASAPADRPSGALPPVEVLETTISEDNTASKRLFASLAERRGARHEVNPLFTAADFPDGHEAEPVHVIDRLRPMA